MPVHLDGLIGLSINPYCPQVLGVRHGSSLGEIKSYVVELRDVHE
jgi:hypothetical protein